MSDQPVLPTPQSKTLWEYLTRAQAAQAAVDGIVGCEGHHCAEHSPVGFTCPQCQMTSYNPNDVAQGYCGNCHAWTGKGY